MEKEEIFAEEKVKRRLLLKEAEELLENIRDLLGLA